MRQAWLFTFAAFLAYAVYGLAASAMPFLHGGIPPTSIFPLHVSGGLLETSSNTPFQIVGDTAQDMVMIPETGSNSAATYFASRAALGFNTTQIWVLCDNYNQCNGDGSTFDGIEPFTGQLGSCAGGLPGCYDLTTPNPAYFQRILDFVNMAASYGMLVQLDPIPTQACESGTWFQTMQNNTTAAVTGFGTYLGNLFKNVPNIMWLSGNDFQCFATTADDQLAADVVSGIVGAGDTHPQTVELSFFDSSTFDDTGPLKTHMNVNSVYTYYPTYFETQHALGQSSTPAFLVESNYEGMNNTGGDPSTAILLRKQEWWVRTYGGMGTIFGNQFTWNFSTGWPSHLSTTGAIQAGYVGAFFAGIEWWTLAADTSHTMLTAGFGTACSSPCQTSGTMTSNTYATSAFGSSGDATTGVVYDPAGAALTIALSVFGPSVNARWYDPTNNTFTAISGSPFSNTGSHSFSTPGNNSAGAADWVLLLQGGHL